MYSVLDKLEINKEFFRGELYVPREHTAKLSVKLNRMIPQPSLTEIASINPPTAFRVTGYTVIAQ